MLRQFACEHRNLAAMKKHDEVTVFTGHESVSAEYIPRNPEKVSK